MAPGVIHQVTGLEDCIMVGGHLYDEFSLRRSFHSGIEEAVLGQSNTNTEHTTSETILYRLMKYYARTPDDRK